MLSCSQTRERVAQQRENQGHLGKVPQHSRWCTDWKVDVLGFGFLFLFLPSLLCHSLIREGKVGGWGASGELVWEDSKMCLI